jgi:hypothetical protein
MTAATRVFRSNGLYWATLLFALGFGTYSLVYGVLVATGRAEVGHRTLSGLDALSSGLVFAGFTAFAWVLWWRLGCARMIVGSDAVEIMNPLRQHVIARDDIGAFYLTPRNGWVFLVTKSGRRILVFALSVGLRWTLRRRMENVARMVGIPLA